MSTTDVLVLGGGSAGLAAAVSAARRGARTTLVERHGFAGGMGTASLVHTFCGLYRAGGATAVLANPGLPAEIERHMRTATGQEPVKMGRVWVLMQHPVDFATL
ncbi:MAG: FAD-dependent oxidoreductase, partial [Akkermansiaceae bacterium]|nr:FAD-dependent oxidoreductase [Akkermansiaceae bacterium]